MSSVCCRSYVLYGVYPGTIQPLMTVFQAVCSVWGLSWDHVTTADYVSGHMFCIGFILGPFNHCWLCFRPYVLYGVYPGTIQPLLTVFQAVCSVWGLSWDHSTTADCVSGHMFCMGFILGPFNHCWLYVSGRMFCMGFILGPFNHCWLYGSGSIFCMGFILGPFNHCWLYVSGHMFCMGFILGPFNHCWLYGSGHMFCMGFILGPFNHYWLCFRLYVLYGVYSGTIQPLLTVCFRPYVLYGVYPGTI